MTTNHTPGYEVTREGAVYSVSSNWRGLGRRLLNVTPNTDGYPSVRLHINGKRVRLGIHKLVALHHLPPKPSARHELRHLDGNKDNAHADNLTWGTPKENAADRELHGHTSRGEAHSATIKASNQKVNVPRGSSHYETRAALARAKGE
jgi:hypothetical protein